jgi:hypothetical protein
MPNARDTKVTIVTVADLVAIAQREAARDDQHSYTKAPNFVPHDWVVAAMAEAYELGARNACDRLRQSKP